VRISSVQCEQVTQHFLGSSAPRRSRSSGASGYAKALRPNRQVLVGPGAWGGRPLAEVVRTERIIDFNESDGGLKGNQVTLGAEVVYNFNKFGGE
jgi:hypothetical protein